MGTTLFEKIVSSHLVSGSMEEGQEIGVRIDQTLLQDATGPLVCLQLESLGIERMKTELLVAYVDHTMHQFFPENADDHRYLHSCAVRYGGYFSRAGNGICHQVHLERFAHPGKTLLGADSHTPTSGALGMLAMGAGGLDVAMAIAGHPYFIKFPRIVGIRLTGRLTPWVSAMDVVLRLLGMLTARGNTQKVLEYSGDGLKFLTVAERATLANLGAEMGVMTSLFPSDDTTRQFMRRHQREAEWEELLNDPHALYAEVVTIALDEVIPLVARPHSPDHVCPVKEVEGLKVEQICIGSCAHSSYRELAVVASVLKGKKVSPQVSLCITPGSRRILSAITMSGVLADLVNAGARIMEPACGFCIGQGQVPPSGSISLRTSNRNYRGRCGTPDAEVYLVSPETAAVSALTGSLTDPRSLGDQCSPLREEPEVYQMEDELLIAPGENVSEPKVIKGPSIKELPYFYQLDDTLTGEVVLKVGDNITTDHIIPGGQYLRFRSDIARYAQFTFQQLDSEFYKKALHIKEEGKEGVIVAGEGYGQGSSREHAALCPRLLGVRVVIALRIERIHQANLVNYGILPLLFKREEDYEQIETGDRLKLERIRDSLKGYHPLVVHNLSKQSYIPLLHTLNQREVAIVVSGGLIPYRREHGA
jgi:aconitate hydratase